VTSPAELADEFVSVGDLPHREIDRGFDAYERDAVLDEYAAVYRDLTDGD